MDLSDDELEFLAHYELSADDVFDARGWPSKARKQRAKELGKLLLLGTRCERGGHRLRTRAGHCVQCDTGKMAYSSRFSTSGYVYIAGSREKQLIKIGGSKAVGARLNSLRGEIYGGAYDWRLLHHVMVPNFGKIEHEAQAFLAQYSTQLLYFKGDQRQVATEVYQCSFTTARDALDKALQLFAISKQREWTVSNCDDYEFAYKDG